MKITNRFLCLILGWLFLMSPSSFASDLMEGLGGIIIQDAGRTKPFDTFAREALQLIYGRQKFKRKNGKKLPASDVVFTWMLVPEHWDTVKLVQVRNSRLRQALKLDDVEVFYSPQELLANERLPLLIQELSTKREAKEKLDGYYQAVQTLENQVSLYQAIKTGRMPGVWPAEKDGGRWASISELEGEASEKFKAISTAFVKKVVAQQTQEDLGNLRSQLGESVKAFQEAQGVRLGEAKGEVYSKAKYELFYNKVHPFMWAWIIYLLGALIALFHFRWTGNLRKSSIALTLIGLALHTLGFAIRSYITGRPPVSNMYETVVWVSWGAVFFALILELFHSSRLLMLGGGIIAIFCLILSDLAPVVLDPTLQPLEPVLRDNFWLVIHVMVITISYAAFFLALGVANSNLFHYLKEKSIDKKVIKDNSLVIYRAIQVGVVLLAAGIILGGIWADYSWGRFWGWDPKETWALIALLGYIAILHGRLIGWVKDFALSAWTIVAFALVVMAWYGVNFVLGAGLHSYGFGAGGVEVVSAVVAIQLVFVIYVSLVFHSRNKKSEKG